MHVLMSLLTLIISLIPFTASGEIFGDYVGYKACEQCHADKVEGWLTTGHARAFENLKKQGEEGQENPGCVKCHVTAMDADGGFIDLTLTPELKDVQCESCHGPGAKHVESEDATDIDGNPKEDACKACHTPGQDKNFDFGKKSLLVHGGK